MESKIRTLIVDDERLSREKIRMLLKHDPEIEVIGECENGEEAIRSIREDPPDLLFLDIQMPGANGFDVLTKVGVENIAAIIFVTAFDEYALRAFEFHALDYLLKPFAARRFKAALHHAKDQLRQAANGTVRQVLASFLKDFNRERGYIERMLVRSSGRVFFVRVTEIDWIEAAGNYVRVHVGKETHLVHKTMNQLETVLNPTQFIRIHRSTIVNIENVKELKPLFLANTRCI